MPRRDRDARRAPDERHTSVLTKLRQPSDVVAMIPYVVGFMPADSVVVVSLQGVRQRFGPCFRLDLAASADDAEAQARYLAEVVGGHGFGAVLIVAFCGDVLRADAVVHPFLRELRERRVRVVEALRADGHRWWSYLCSDPACCSPDGSAYDSDSSWVAAEAVLAGMHRVPDRDSLRQQFEPLQADVRVVAAECERLRKVRGTAHLDISGLDRIIERNLPDPDSMPVSDIAELLLALQWLALRDAAWSLMSRADAHRHFLVWRRVMTAAPDELMAPAGSLAGFAAWLDGRGVDARHAAERVQQVRPGYSMCGLLVDILEATLDPEMWSDFPFLRDPS